MHCPRIVLLGVLISTAVQGVVAPATFPNETQSRELDALVTNPKTKLDVTIRDEGHHHHGAPSLTLNETAILMWHSPTPPSYWTVDVVEGSGNGGLMIVHGIMMSAAFFIALPAGEYWVVNIIKCVTNHLRYLAAIAMRSVKHAWRGAATCAFYILCIIGCSASALYTKITPNM